MAVYMFQIVGGGPVKIGYATNVRDRFWSSKTALPYEIEILRTLDGFARAEGFFHDRFSQHHIRGEWFRFDPEMLTVVPPEIPPRLLGSVSSKARVASILKLIGGEKVAGDRFRVVPATTRTWVGHGFIPPRQHFALIDFAAKLGVDLPDSSCATHLGHPYSTQTEAA